MKTQLRNSLLVLVLLSLTACMDGIEGQKIDSLVDEPLLNKVLFLAEASPRDIESVSMECPSNRPGKRECVVICHIPPGNPDNYRTLLIPRQAVRAHINHGGPHHEHHDFIGHCSQLNDDTGDNNDGGGADDGGDNGGGGGADDGAGDGGDDDILFCDGLLEYDLDCDGIHDQTGEPLL